MTITLALPSPKLSPNSRLHWSAKHRLTKVHRHRAKLTTISHIATHGKTHTAPTTYKLHFHFPDRRKRDDDNAIASCKAYRDGIADALGLDDHTLHLTAVDIFVDAAQPRLEVELM